MLHVLTLAILQCLPDKFYKVALLLELYLNNSGIILLQKWLCPINRASVRSARFPLELPLIPKRHIRKHNRRLNLKIAPLPCHESIQPKMSLFWKNESRKKLFKSLFFLVMSVCKNRFWKVLIYCFQVSIDFHVFTFNMVHTLIKIIHKIHNIWIVELIHV